MEKGKELRGWKTEYQEERLYHCLIALVYRL